MIDQARYTSFKSLALRAAVISGFALLAACGDPTPQTVSTTTQETTTAPATVPAPALVPGAPGTTTTTTTNSQTQAPAQ